MTDNATGKEQDENASSLEDDATSKDKAVVPASVSGKSNVDKTPMNVEVHAETLEQAVAQLQQLTALRQQEGERQERIIAGMEQAIGRQRRMSRWLMTISLLMIACSIGVVMLVMNLRTVNELVSQGVQQLTGTVTTSTRTIQETAVKQSQALAEMNENVTIEAGRQVQALAKVEDEVLKTKQVLQQEASATKEVLRKEVAETRATMQQEAAATKAAVQEEVARVGGELQATRAAVTRESDKQVLAISAMNTEMTTRLSEQSQDFDKVKQELTGKVGEVALKQEAAIETVKNEVFAVRDAQAEELEKVRSELSADRDRVQAEVKQLLEERMQLLTRREIELHDVQEKLHAEETRLQVEGQALRAEEDRIAMKAAEAQEQTQNIISNALRKLADIEGAPQVHLGDEPAVQQLSEPETPVEKSETEGAVVTEQAADVETQVQ